MFAIVALALSAAAISNGGTVTCTYYDSASPGAPAHTASEHVGVSSGAGGYGIAAAVLVLLIAVACTIEGVRDAFFGAKIDPSTAVLRWAIVVVLCVAVVLSLVACIVLAKSSSDAESKLEEQTFSSFAVSATCANRDLAGLPSCSCGVGGVAIASAAFHLICCVTAIIALVFAGLTLHYVRTQAN